MTLDELRYRGPSGTVLLTDPSRPALHELL